MENNNTVKSTVDTVDSIDNLDSVNRLDKMIYLASPYSHSIRAVRNDRFRLVAWWAARLRVEYLGYFFYSPVCHSHPIAEYMGNYNDGRYWLRECMVMIPWFDELWVLKLDGWGVSSGIREEVARAEGLYMPVVYIDAGGDTDSGND